MHIGAQVRATPLLRSGPVLVLLEVLVRAGLAPDAVRVVVGAGPRTSPP